MIKNLGNGGGGGSVIVTGAESWTGAAVVSPAALAIGTTHNYNPAGMATARLLRLTPDAGNSALGGLVPGLAGQVLTISNIAAAGNLTLLNEAAGSTASNRFIGIGGGDLVIPPGAKSDMFYDSNREPMETNLMKRIASFLVGLLLALPVLGANVYDYFQPATGVLKGSTSTYVTTAAAAADITGLFSGCSGVQYLGADGACHSITFSPGGADTQVQYNSSGSFAGSSNFVWNAGSSNLNIGSSLIPGSYSVGTLDAMTISGVALSVPAFAANSNTQGNLELHSFTSASAAAGPFMYGARARNTLASPTTVSNGDNLLTIAGAGYDGTNYTWGAHIHFLADGTPSAGVLPGAIDFQTTPSASNTPVSVFKLDHVGSYFVNGSQGTSGNVLVSAGTGATAWGTVGLASANSVSGLLGVTNGGVGVGTLTSHGVLLGQGTSAVTAVAAMAADTLLQGKGASADPAAVAVNNCGDATHALSYNTTTHAFGCQAITATASPAGSNQQIQYNASGSFGASSTFTWDNSGNTFTLGPDSASTVTIATPARGTSGAGPALTIQTGAGNTAGASGVLTLKTGDAAGTSAAAAINLTGGNGGSTTSAGGAISLTGGTGASTAAGGVISITGGNGGSTSGSGAAVNVTGGQGVGASAAGGAVVITGGSPSAGAGGAVTVFGGDSTTGSTNGATATLKGGKGSSTGTGGYTSIQGGAGGSTSGAGGNAEVIGGTATDGNGGSALLTGRSGVGTNRNGGSAIIAAGNATGTGTPGPVTLTAGSASDANGGSVTLNATNGVGTNRDAGNIVLSGGTPTGSGATASITLNNLTTTGAQTATFSATNKPGSATGAPTLWLKIMVSGVTYWVPLFAN